MNIYRHNHPFELERGGILPELTIAFSTYGKLNAAHDNVIWVCHALTADSDVASWWPHTVEAGCTKRLRVSPTLARWLMISRWLSSEEACSADPLTRKVSTPPKPLVRYFLA